MGAVTVVNGTDGMAMPDKYQSYMRAMMRATAERHGKTISPDGKSEWRRNPLVAEAMVDPRVSVGGLIDSTRVLTFTADEAVKWNYADGAINHCDGSHRGSTTINTESQASATSAPKPRLHVVVATNAALLLSEVLSSAVRIESAWTTPRSAVSVEVHNQRFRHQGARKRASRACRV